jgi:hypothetical protein
MNSEMENYEKKEVIKNFKVADKDVVKCSQHGKLHGFVHFSKKQLNEKRTVTISGKLCRKLFEIIIDLIIFFIIDLTLLDDEV